jgi:hypothetical protein
MGTGTYAAMRDLGMDIQACIEACRLSKTITNKVELPNIDFGHDI